jgi:hypothetical protein
LGGVVSGDVLLGSFSSRLVLNVFIGGGCLGEGDFVIMGHVKAGFLAFLFRLYLSLSERERVLGRNRKVLALLS